MTVAAGFLFTSAAWAQKEGTREGQAAPAPPAFKTEKDKADYAVGLNIGENLRRSGMKVDVSMLMRGLNDALSGAKPALSEEELQAAFELVQKDIAARESETAKLQAEKGKQMGDKNKTEGAAFHAENKKKEGVVTLPSGLQYKVLKAGKGATPKLTDTVTTHYKGTLLDGSTFDSSYDRGQPATFPVAGVISGWTEALQKMKVGDKWQLFIPGNLAYGERGAGGKIGPNATLVFEIELLGVESQQQPKK